MPTTTLNTLSLVTLVAGSSVLAAFVTKGVDLWTAVTARGVEADFAALYLAVALEAYADQCSEIVSGSENYESSRGDAGTAHGNIAALPPYPEDINWKALGIKAATEAMTFRIEVENIRSMIAGLWEFDDEATIGLVRENAVDLGLKALSTAERFRRARHIAPVQYQEEWSVKDHLLGRKAFYDGRREKREARRAAASAELDI